MAVEVLEKKVWYIGTWSDNSFTDTIIREVATHVEVEKGSKVRLSLSPDGIRVVKSNFVQGKYLHSFIPILNIYYMVVNQYNPSCILVIAKSKKKKYQIIGYRCANGLDAGLFVQTFKGIHKSLKPGEGYNFDLKTHDGINWTLRSKSEAASANTRQLSQLVDIHGETAVIQQNGDIGDKTKSEPNNNEEQQKPHVVDTGPTGVRVQLKGNNSPNRITHYRHGKQQTEANLQVVTREDFRDSVSEASENVVIFNELDHLSHEIKEIKFMLEKSTGISAEHHHQKVPVPEIKQYNRNMASELMDAEILPDNYEMVVVNDSYSQIDNGHNHSNEDSGVKVDVPDYRGSEGQTAPKSQHHMASNATTTTKQPIVNYNKWQNNYMTVPSKTESVKLRNSVFRPRVYSSSRPRSATFSNRWVPVEIDTSENISIRGHPNKVSFDPSLVPDPHAVRRRTTMSFSTTVRRPIEKVYQRPSMFRSTPGHRPISVFERPNFAREHHAATYVLTPEDEVKTNPHSNDNFEQRVVVPSENRHSVVRSS